MRAKPLILIFVAAACGLVASIGVSEALKGRNEKAESELETTKIYVALTALAIGEPITPQMVKLEAWPTNLVPEGALTKLEDVEKHRPRQPLFPGEPIVEAKLIQSNRDHEIPAGYRVVSVKVSMETAVSNLLAPGDRVDVLVFLRKSQEIKKTTTRTLLRNVKVYAINERVDRVRAAMETETTQAKTVSLLVTPKQVEKVMLATELGMLQLSMRGAGDTTESDGAGDAWTDIGSTFDGLENDPFADVQTQPATTEREPALAAMPAPAEDTTWRMDVLSPEGVEQYEAASEDAMPQLISGDMQELNPVIPNFPMEDPTAGLPEEATKAADDDGTADDLPVSDD